MSQWEAIKTRERTPMNRERTAKCFPDENMKADTAGGRWGERTQCLFFVDLLLYEPG